MTPIASPWSSPHRRHTSSRAQSPRSRRCWWRERPCESLVHRRAARRAVEPLWRAGRRVETPEFNHRNTRTMTRSQLSIHTGLRVSQSSFWACQCATRPSGTSFRFSFVDTRPSKPCVALRNRVPPYIRTTWNLVDGENDKCICHEVSCVICSSMQTTGVSCVNGRQEITHGNACVLPFTPYSARWAMNQYPVCQGGYFVSWNVPQMWARCGERSVGESTDNVRDAS